MVTESSAAPEQSGAFLSHSYLPLSHERTLVNNLLEVQELQEWEE